MNTNLRIATVVLALVILGSCRPSESAIQEAIILTQTAWTPVPTQTPFPTPTPAPTHTPYATYTPAATVAVEVTRIVVVTVTSTPTPRYTPTETSTPTVTCTATQTPNATQTAEALLTAKLRATRGNGFYLVNVDIAPGIWRSQGTGDACYWATTTKTGNIISNHFGMAGGTAYISPGAFQVEFNDCGKWEFMSPP